MEGKDENEIKLDESGVTDGRAYKDERKEMAQDDESLFGCVKPLGTKRMTWDSSRKASSVWNSDVFLLYECEKIGWGHPSVSKVSPDKNGILNGLVFFLLQNDAVRWIQVNTEWFQFHKPHALHWYWLRGSMINLTLNMSDMLSFIKDKRLEKDNITMVIIINCLMMMQIWKCLRNTFLLLNTQ